VRGARSGNINWSLISFFLAFYSYHATKFVFLFLLPVLLIMFYTTLKNRKREVIIFIGGYLIILFSFFLTMSTAGVTRQDETILSYQDPRAAGTVNYELDKNQAPLFVSKLFNNKPLYFLRVIRENYLEVFSTNFLFLYGDTSSSAKTLGVLSRGVMYLIELPLLLLGLYYLMRHGARAGRNVVLAGLLIAPLASTFVSGKSYILRNLFLTPFLSIVVGCGIYTVILLIKKYPPGVRNALLFCFFGVYGVFVLSYLYQYHFRYSVYGAEAWFRSDREVVQLISKESKSSDHVYVVAPGKIMLAQYGIFGKIDAREVQKAWITSNPVIGNVTFLEKCPNLLKFPKTSKAKKSVYILPFENCSQNVSPVKVITDYGESSLTLWQVYEV